MSSSARSSALVVRFTSSTSRRTFFPGISKARYLATLRPYLYRYFTQSPSFYSALDRKGRPIVVAFPNTLPALYVLPIFFDGVTTYRGLDWGYVIAAFLGVSFWSLTTLAYSGAPAAKLAPFTYTQLIWSALIGLTIFGEWPGIHTRIGAFIIVAACLYVSAPPVTSPTRLPRHKVLAIQNEFLDLTPQRPQKVDWGDGHARNCRSRRRRVRDGRVSKQSPLMPLN